VHHILSHNDVSGVSFNKVHDEKDQIVQLKHDGASHVAMLGTGGGLNQECLFSCPLAYPLLAWNKRLGCCCCCLAVLLLRGVQTTLDPRLKTLQLLLGNGVAKIWIRL
jgi:hypothetical protein